MALAGEQSRRLIDGQPVMYDRDLTLYVPVVERSFSSALQQDQKILPSLHYWK